ncbi:chemotaxis protein CheB [Candidatus Poribacteria bacterium]|nr:chemotaxis protein CheB [Candidatus Poribacteria bacterium]
MKALLTVLSRLHEGFQSPIIVVLHVHPTESGYLAEHLGERCGLPVKEALDKEPAQAGVVYVAPPGYHLLVEREETLALSADEPVRFARPSIDVLFESAAHVWSWRLIGVILSGANSDGAYGISQIRKFGGLTIAQDPTTAEYPVMPQSAVDTASVAKILSPEEIGGFLGGMNCSTK